MVHSRGSLGLTIPTLTHTKGPTFDAQPKKVEAWIGALPRAHVGETSRLIYNALHEANRTDLPPDQRFAVLELFFEPMDYVIKSLRKHFLGSPFPLSQKSSKVAALVRELLTEYAAGYKIIIEKQLSGRAVAPDNRYLLRSVYRAIEYLSLLSFHCYQTYSPHSAGTWLEIHKLYGFSRTANTHHSALPDLQHMFLQPDSIDDLYKQQLLLALVNPYQLSQEDIESIYACLSFWSTHAVLSQTEDHGEPAGLFAVNLDDDSPPAYYAFRPGQHSQCLILDTTDLAAYARQLLRHGGAEHITIAIGNDARRLANDTVKRMLLSWGSLSKRGFKRRGTSSRTHVIIGLSAIHDALRGTAAKPGRAARPESIAAELRSTFTSQSVVGADGSGAYPEMWDFTSASQTELRHEKDGSFSRVQKRQDLNRGATAPVELQTFNITNESAGGYCLLWKQKIAGNLKVGELLCMREPNEELETYNICVVRWMKNIGDMMVMGVEILAANAEPVAVKLVDESGQRSTAYTRGLILPAVDALQRPATLVTSTLFRSNDPVMLKSTASEQKAKLEDMSQLTTAFKQFRFVLEHESNAVEANGFESIWASI